MNNTVVWDGTMEGKRLLQGVNVYRIEYMDSENKSKIIIGDLGFLC